MRAVLKIYLLVVILALSTSCSNNNSLPKGWRMPTSDELKDSWRNENDTRFTLVKGDFNGDGVVDEARLLVREDGSGIGLFVFLSQKNHSFKTYQLDELKDKIQIRAMGIKKVMPGSYKTACGKGYWDCKKDETPTVNINLDAINYFKTESANSFFYFDTNSNVFKRIWMSD